MGAIAVVAFRGIEAIKKRKHIKLQLCNKQYLMVRAYYSKKMKIDEEEKKLENFLFSFPFSTGASHLCNIESSYLIN